MLLIPIAITGSPTISGQEIKVGSYIRITRDVLVRTGSPTISDQEIKVGSYISVIQDVLVQPGLYLIFRRF